MAATPTIGPYELLDELGRGAMGCVYRARHLPTGALRALKLLLGPTDPDAVVRFRREAEALAKVAGRGVVPIHDMGLERGQLYFVMSLLAGGSLRRKLETQGVLPWREAVTLVAKLARALARCHAEGLVHRDVKPDNVLLDEQGEPWLADFGLVRDLGASRLTETGTTLGTLGYMSPEQLDARPVDARTDVYALGVLLHECVEGRRPFDGPSVLAQLSVRASPRPRLTAKECPSTLDGVLDRALAFAPEKRTESAALLARELEALRDGAKDDGGARGPLAVAALSVIVVGLAILSVFVALALQPTDTSPHFLPPPTPVTPPPGGASKQPVDWKPFAAHLYLRGLDPSLSPDAAIAFHGVAYSLDRPRTGLESVIALWRAYSVFEGSEDEWIPGDPRSTLNRAERNRYGWRLTWGWRAHRLDPLGDSAAQWEKVALARGANGYAPLQDMVHEMLADGVPREHPLLVLLESMWQKRNGHAEAAFQEAFAAVADLTPYDERENPQLGYLVDALLGQVLTSEARTDRAFTREEIETCDRASLHERQGGHSHQIGLLWLALKDVEKARACLLRAERVAPRSSDTYSFRVTLLQQTGDPEGAFREARRWDDETPTVFSKIALAHAFQSRGMWHELSEMPRKLSEYKGITGGLEYLECHVEALWRLGRRGDAEALVEEVPALRGRLRALEAEGR